MRAKSMKQMGKSAKKLFNFEKTFGISNRVVHHGWNIFMMGLVVILYLYYSTPILGGYHNVGAGLLAVPGIMVPEVPCAILYGITLLSMFDYEFVLGFLYKVSMCNLIIAIACFAIDNLLFLFSHEAYCKLQLEYHHSSCAERNEHIFVITGLFLGIFCPLWYASANATRRFAADFKRQKRHSVLEQTPLRRPQTLDSAAMQV